MGRDTASERAPDPGGAATADRPAMRHVADQETVEQALNRAQAAARAKRLNEASGICADILAAHADQPAALALQGIIAAMAGDHEQGIVRLRRAIQFRPGNATWHAHLALLCRQTNRMDEALAAGQESLRLDASNPEHLVNLSLIFTDLDDQDRALACLLRALGLRHDYADAHLALAQNLLAMGEFQAGWIEYEWRNLTEAGKATLPAITSASWNGMRIPNGRLLLLADQGYGDTIQFARYIPLAAERCREVVLACSPELASLLAAIPGVAQFCQNWSDIPGHAAHCRVSSLPYLFQTKSDTIPSRTPYLRAEPSRVAFWHDRLASTLPAGVRRVGLAWAGRSTHPNDWRRSLPLARLAPLRDAGSGVFISLQKSVPQRDRDAMALFRDMTDLSDQFDDFGDTAALIENLDLVITVDTAIGHLAGALGKKVWILIPKAADWRWMLTRHDSPWYPSARLFRQQAPGDWEEPLSRLRDALREELAGQLQDATAG